MRMLQGFMLRRLRTNLRRIYLASILIFTNPVPATFIVGSGLILIGVLGHFWAAGYLTRGKTLVVSGPYRVVRNPFYTAALFIDLGFGLATRNWIALAVFLPLITLVYFRRILREEKNLLATFGSDYEAYKDYCRARLIPRFWNFRRPPPSGTVQFSLLQVIKNREIQRSLSHILILALTGIPILYPEVLSWAPLWARGAGLGLLAVVLVVLHLKKPSEESESE
jgi:protein-S-isoprenylcysteine O-methyltransferase Ste14